mgnify:CR=1 FL=1
MNERPSFEMIMLELEHTTCVVFCKYIPTYLFLIASFFTLLVLLSKLKLGMYLAAVQLLTISFTVQFPNLPIPYCMVVSWD